MPRNRAPPVRRAPQSALRRAEEHRTDSQQCRRVRTRQTPGLICTRPETPWSLCTRPRTLTHLECLGQRPSHFQAPQRFDNQEHRSACGWTASCLDSDYSTASRPPASTPPSTATPLVARVTRQPNALPTIAIPGRLTAGNVTSRAPMAPSDRPATANPCRMGSLPRWESPPTCPPRRRAPPPTPQR